MYVSTPTPRSSRNPVHQFQHCKSIVYILTFSIQIHIGLLYSTHNYLLPYPTKWIHFKNWSHVWSYLWVLHLGQNAIAGCTSSAVTGFQGPVCTVVGSDPRRLSCQCHLSTSWGWVILIEPVPCEMLQPQPCWFTGSSHITTHAVLVVIQINIQIFV